MDWWRWILERAVKRAKWPGKATVWFVAYRSTLPKSARLFRFLNLSPPCAANAARASSTGVLFAVIGGGAGIVLAAAAPLPLDFASGAWANAAEVHRNKTTSVRAYLFMVDSLSFQNPERKHGGSALKLRLGSARC